MNIEFEKVTAFRARTVIVNGKKKRQQKTFTQTINPWNKDADGKPKSRAQVWVDVENEADEWAKEPTP